MVMDTNIPEGYQLTDVGVIPKNWIVKEFENIGKVIDGDRGVNYPRENEFTNDGYCLFLTAKNVTKEGFKISECVFITKEKDGLLSKGKLAKKDIVLTTRGTVGNTALFDDTIPYCNIRINSGMVILRNENNQIDTNYLYKVFKSQIIRNQINKVVFGSAQPQLTVKVINKFRVPLPPLPEQKAIAGALSDVDALLDSLEQLIEKKQNIKKGAMQQLLTGKKRLPGFSNEWVVKTLGEKTIKVGSGITPTGGEKIYRKEGRPFLRSQNIGWGNLFLDDIAYIDDETHNTFKSTEINKNDVFLNITGASIGRSAVADDRVENGNVNQHVCIIRTIEKELNPNFLNYFLLSKNGQKQIDSYQAGGNRQGLNFGQIKSFQIPFPPLPEQQAVAEILNDMDKEIEALEKKREKYKAIKQGMMQELLTGKTRLI